MEHRLDIRRIAKVLGLGSLLGLSLLAAAPPAKAQPYYDDPYYGSYDPYYGGYDTVDPYYGRDYYGETYTTRRYRVRGHHDRRSPRYRAIRRLKDDYDNDGWSNVNDRFPYDPYRH